MACQRSKIASSNATAERRPVDQKQHFYKTVPCKFYMKGKCTRGRDCVYAHAQIELQPKPNFYKTRFCVKFMTDGCCANGNLCSYAHQNKELRQKTLQPQVGSSSQATDIASRMQLKPKATPLFVERNSKPTDEASLATTTMHQSTIMSTCFSRTSPRRNFRVCDGGKDNLSCQPNTFRQRTEGNDRQDEDVDHDWKVLGIVIVQNTFLEWKPMNWAEGSDAARRSRSAGGRIECRI